MMRIQYDNLISGIYKLVDKEIELDTKEGSDVFRVLTSALFDFYHPKEVGIGLARKAEERSANAEMIQ